MKAKYADTAQCWLCRPISFIILHKWKQTEFLWILGALCELICRASKHWRAPSRKDLIPNLNSPYCSYKSDLPHRRVHQIEHTSTLKSALSDSTDSGKVLLAFSAFYGSPAAASALQENFNFFSGYLFIYLLTNMHDVSQSFFFILIRIYFVCWFLCSYLTVHLLMWDKTFCF